MLYQHVTLKYYETLIRNKIKSDDIPTEDEEDVTLTYEEENAIRYMSGYVIQKLSSKCGPLDFLTLQDQDEIAEMESSEWILNIDRGGLVHVTDDCFQLFLSLECAIRRHLKNNKDRKADEIFKNMEKI